MARIVKISEFQAMQGGANIDSNGDERIDPIVEDQAATQALKRIGAPVNGKVRGRGAQKSVDALAAALVDEKGTDPKVARIAAEAVVDSIQVPEPDHAELLQSLNVEARCSGRSLNDIVVLVGNMAVIDSIQATEEQIQAEAERIYAAVNGVQAGGSDSSTTGETAKSEPADSDEDQPGVNEPSIADHLLGLGVERECTAEMSLHMITEWVREAALSLAAQYAPTENDIVLEAERIWVSLDRKRSHTYSVDPDGSVRDWRRPDTTPDRGDDVGTTHQTLTDAYAANEPRFSGGGAEDMPWGEAGRNAYTVPTDQQFNGRLYRDAPDLANLAEKLIGEHGHLEGLINCEIRYYWRRKTGVSKGRVKIGLCKRASDLLGHFSGADFLIWLSATTARDGKFTPRQVEAAVFHQLCHIETDDEGNFISARHDFEGFAAEVRHYGTWTEDLKLGRNAYRAAEQMGLFDSDEDDEDLEVEDDREEAAQAGYVETPDGAGVLIHSDGTALTDDEIEALERHELADDDETIAEERVVGDVRFIVQTVDDDEPADPDGPSPEDEDILADPKVI